MHQRIHHSTLRCLLLQVLAILAFTTNLALSQNASPPLPALSSPPPPGPTPTTAQCPVSVQYNVNLGQGQDTALVPIFVATLTLTNNQVLASAASTAGASTLPSADNNLTIQSWRIGWKFPFNSTIKTPQDVFDPSVVLLTPDSITPVLEELSSSDNSTSTTGIAPGQSRQFGFLGTKGSGPLSPTNPYNVGSVTGMVFNNLLCTMISSTHQQQLAAQPGEAATNPNLLEIQYTPIQYVDDPTLINTFNQFLVRVRNVGNGSTLNLPSIGLQYWFQGPEGYIPPSVDASPWDFFEARCEWATIGCDLVKLGISTGFPDVSGARFALNVTLAESAGALLPSGDAAVPALFLGQEGIDVLDLLLTITTKSGVVLLNSTQDYSFLDTPVLEQTASGLPQQQAQPQRQQRLNTTTGGSNAVLVPRKAVVNKKMPAYINGQLAWGILPSTSTQTLLAPAPEAAAVRVTESDGSNQAVQLPEGVFCESIRGGAQQSCTLQAVYCCVPADPRKQPGVSSTIPSEWPPKGATVAVDGTPPSTNNTTNDTVLSSGSGTSISGIVPGQEESSTTVFFPPLPKPGSQDQLIAGTEQQQNNNGGGGSLAWIAGIAVGIAVGGVLGVVFFIAKRRKRRRQQRQQRSFSKDAIVPSAAQNGAMFHGKIVSLNVASAQSSESPFSLKRPPTTPSSPGVDVNAASGPLAFGSGTSSPLLRSPPAVAGTGLGLFKHPSGISGSTSSSTDPTAVLDSTFNFNSTNFSDGVQTNTLPNSPFAASTFMKHGEAIMEAGGVQEENGRAGGSGAKALPSNILQLLERKACTCPGSLFSSSSNSSRENAAKKQSRRRKQHHDRGEVAAEVAATAAGGELTGLAALDRLASNSNKAGRRSSSSNSSESDSEQEEEEGDVFNSNPDIEPWQLRRSASWHGILQDTHSSDSFSHISNLKRRRTAPKQLPAPLPPFSPLPSPLLPSQQGPGPGIDLDVDPFEIVGHLGKCLGTGGFGSVYEAEWRGKKVAIKMLPSFVSGSSGGDNNYNANSDAAYKALLGEIQLASKFDSDRLVKVYGACTRDRNHCCLIMELAKNGSLFQRIHDRRKRRLSYLEILQLGHDIAAGLAYLHPAVVHRDLKPQNVLLDADGRAKLADFGISRIKDPTKSYFSQVTAENGTPMYMSPESMNGTRVDEKVDVYALGVILNEAWTRKQPWKDSAHFFQIILKVAINGERPYMDPDCPEPLKRLITKCWHQDPRQRPSCADVMRLTDLLMQEELRKYEELRTWYGV